MSHADGIHKTRIGFVRRSKRIEIFLPQLGTGRRIYIGVITKPGGNKKCISLPNTIFRTFDEDYLTFLNRGNSVRFGDDGRSEQVDLEGAQRFLRRIEERRRYDAGGGVRRSSSQTFRNCDILAFLEREWASARDAADRALSEAERELEPSVLARVERLRGEAIAAAEGGVAVACRTEVATLDPAREAQIRSGAIDAPDTLACLERFKPFGFLYQTEALFERASFFDSGDEADPLQYNPVELAAISLGLTMLFAFLETAPVLAKLLGRPGPYELDLVRKQHLARESALGSEGGRLTTREFTELRIEGIKARADEIEATQNAEYLIGLRERILPIRAALLVRAAQGEEVADQIAKCEALLAGGDASRDA